MHTLHLGDCLEVLRTMPDCSIDAVVTDPPYGLSFMGKKWDYDVPSVEVWAECLRVLKPGGHLLAFAGTRTQHRMACRIEDAGFEIRDMIAWVYGSGFPKSLDVSKAIDKAAGAEREVVGKYTVSRDMSGGSWADLHGIPNTAKQHDITAPATEAARQWAGWGTALKPALEPITVARKPLVGTVAANVLKWNTGALNIDGSRVQNQGSGQGSGGEENPGGSRFCPVHGLRNSGSQVEVKSGQSKVANNLQQTMPGQVDDWAGESQVSREVDSGKVWLHDGSTGLASGIDSGTNPQRCSGGSRASGCDGGDFGPLANPAGAHSSRQRGQAGQQAGKPRDLGGSSSQQGAPESLEKACGVGSAEQNPPQCTCANLGRWPANLIHDGSDEVVRLFPQTGPARRNAVSDGRAVPFMQAGDSASGGTSGRHDPGNSHDDAGGSAARFFKQCKGYAEAWPNVTPEPANTAGNSSSQQRRFVASALSDAATWALQGAICSSVSLAPSTSATESELRQLCESVITAIQSIGPRFWHESEPARLSLKLSHASFAVHREPTGITTITASHWTSGGSADPVTFNIIGISTAAGDRASVPRAFYTAKASTSERQGTSHPTIKPLALMAYLCRLVTPPGGTVLDPFMGSGTTIKAANSEGFYAIGIEQDPDSFAMAEHRTDGAQLGLSL
jgi:site-specific DNA-methyltransferase (adenine-specific)